ncbi:MAG: hypothetical protein LIO77_06695 [Rikenellaceae bacterium]|nr:hypothetical protein [Rikenellaceae bacterium]
MIIIGENRASPFTIVIFAEYSTTLSEEKHRNPVTVTRLPLRKLLVCSGPPVEERSDAVLAKIIDQFDGRKVICGGTTSNIVSRELGRPVRVNIGNDGSGLPPSSHMEGVDLVTEGVLTLGRVKHLLETGGENPIAENSPAGDIARMMVQSDDIEFVVGTGMNPVHNDPSLPIELVLRRNIIGEIARILESKYKKVISLNYL